MSQPKRDPHWIDMLWEKHECFGYDNPATLQVEYEGQRLDVLLPNYVPHAEILFSTQAGQLLFLIGRQTRKVYERHVPVLMVAKRRDEGRYEVVVWHEMYPWALDYLGLQSAGGTPEGI